MADFKSIVANMFRKNQAKQGDKILAKARGKNYKPYTNEEIAKLQAISRLPAQMQQEAYKSDKALASRVAELTPKGLEARPFISNVMNRQGNNLIKKLETATGKDIDTTEVENSALWKAGSLAGEVANFALTGGAAGGAVAGLVTKGAKLGKLAQLGANVTGDVVASTPYNLTQAASVSLDSKNPEKEFAKQFAINTALDVGIGGAIGVVPIIAKALKKVPETKVVGDALEKGGAIKDAQVAEAKVQQAVKNLTQRKLKPSTTITQPLPESQMVQPQPDRIKYLRKDDRPDAKPPSYKGEKVLYDDYETGEAGTLGIKLTSIDGKYYLVNWDWNGINGMPIEMPKTRAEKIAKDLSVGNPESYINALDEHAMKYNAERSKLPTERVPYDKDTIANKKMYAKYYGKVLTEKELTFEQPIFSDKFYKNIALGEESFISKTMPSQPQVPTTPTQATIPPQPLQPSTTTLPTQPVPSTQVQPKARNPKTAEQIVKEAKQPIQGSAIKQKISAPIQTQELLDERILLGDTDLISRSHKDALDIAVRKVNDDPISARKELDNATIYTDREIALAQTLKKYYEATGDFENSVEMIVRTSNGLSETGRTLSAARMLFNATPEGRMAVTARNIKRLEDEYSKQLNGKKIEIDEEKLSAIGNATDTAEMERLQQEILVDTWNQIPASWWEKLNAFRRTSLLANPKTMLRNLLGNIVFVPIRSSKNLLATGIESAMNRAGKLDLRTQSVLNPTSTDDIARINFGKNLFDENQMSIMSGSRFSETSRPIEAKVYGDSLIGKSLEFMRKLTAKGLEGGDKLLLKPAYAHALARYMKANGLSPQTITTEQLAVAESVARNEALRSTFRDTHALSSWLIRHKQITPHTSTAGRVGAVALEGITPFTKTPVNIMRRAFDYSPIGVAKGIVRIAKAAKEGDQVGLVRAIDNISSGLTGSGIMALGYTLYGMGLLNGRIPFDSEGNFQKAQGEQGYSLNIGDSSVTIDWVTPAALPLLTGVEIAKRVEEGEIDIMSAFDALADIATPVTELSMMSGFTDVLESVRNSDSAGSTLLTVGTTPFLSYAGQFVPTVSGQVARAIDPVRRSTTSTADSAAMRRIEKFGKKQVAKIPFASKTLQPYIDAWGREDVSSVYERTAENFLTPWFTEPKNITPVDAEIQSLYSKIDKELQTSILPKTKIDYTLRFGGEDVRLGEKEMTLYNKEKGQQSFTALQSLFDTDEYKKSSPDEKAKLISKTYEEARETADIKTLISMGNDEWEVYTDSFSGGKKQYEPLKDAGVSAKDYYEAFKDVQLDDKSGISQYEAYRKLESTNLTANQKALMWNKYNSGWVDKNNPYLGGAIPTDNSGETAKSSGSSSKTSIAAKAYRDGLATKQVQSLKNINIDSPNITKAELKAIIKMLSA